MSSPPSDERQVPIQDRDPLTWGRAERNRGETTGRLIRGAVLFYLAMGAVGIIWIHFGADPAERGVEPWLDRVLGPKPAIACGLGVALGLLLVAVTRMLESWSPVEQLLDGFAAILGRVSMTQALALAIASSIGEELFFRGAMQPWLGVWFTSAIFAACHFPLDRQFLAWPLFAFGAGLSLAYSAEASRSLIAPIVAHCTVNWINLRHIARFAERERREGSR